MSCVGPMLFGNCMEVNSSAAVVATARGDARDQHAIAQNIVSRITFALVSCRIK